jgi:hypothetical protein
MTMSKNYGLVAGISDQKYHQDRNTLSSTGARKLLACPARFKYEQDHPPAPKRAWDFGKLAHRLVLGEGSPIQVIEADNWLTKAVKEQRDEAYANGVVPVLRSEYDSACQMRDSVMAHPSAGGIFAEGTAELSGYWRDEPTDVGLRFRPDFMTTVGGNVWCIDLKTTISANPDEFARSIVKWGYHAQAAFYLRGLKEGYGIDARFLFVAVEKTAPYPVSVIELDYEAIVEGDRMNREAIDLYARCVETNTWPAYDDDIVLINLPAWALPELEITV